ncbi:hypothetical protein [Streptomyces griseoruber]|uniref:Uncharacterized protein n=1 Tax=Streptomyces griseoruber TaxID=1943 RepID=A0A101SSU7_9ACTN|nr:hypothetical protein [Streptomyces griseoruber]KUN79386.1 hypothetical protein AQJ64_28945 [Streptomyces griseoruber]
MSIITGRGRVISITVGALIVVGIGGTLWAVATQNNGKELKASDTCNEGVFSANVEPLERILSPDSSFKSNWSRTATESSLKLTCLNSTSDGAVKMTAVMQDGSESDWHSQLGVNSASTVAHFSVGTEALVWDRTAAIYVECKPSSEGSSHTADMSHPYLSIVAAATGSAGKGDDRAQQDLAQLAGRMFFEAQLQTGCQEDFTAPSGAPTLTSGS